MKSTSDLTQIRQKIQKSAERKKAIFSKEKVENVDLYKPVLNKIMATHK